MGFVTLLAPKKEERNCILNWKNKLVIFNAFYVGQRKKKKKNILGIQLTADSVLFQQASSCKLGIKCFHTLNFQLQRCSSNVAS